MGLIIGMDEAGYGPRLGPLVVTATVWKVPGHPREVDFWSATSEIIDRTRPVDKSRLHVADSKAVYSSSGGIASLERSVMCALNLCGLAASGFHELRQSLAGGFFPADDTAPWYDRRDVPLPLADDAGGFGEPTARWQQCLEKHGIRLRGIVSDVVLTQRFNRLVRRYQSKGMVLSQITMELLAKVWNPEEDEPTLVVGDKHGGRNRYGEFLFDVLDGRLVFRQSENRRRSEYRVGQTRLLFESKAERHFPVALASMVSKYARQAAMELFNSYWSEHVAGVKPTQGYSVDAGRFRQEIAAAQQALGIADDVLWRQR